MTQRAKTTKDAETAGAAEMSPEAVVKRLQVLSETVSRASVAAYLGKSYGDKRKLYEALGYKVTPTFMDFYGRYRRGDIARAIIDKPVKASWRKRCELVESTDNETPFEKAWAQLVKDLHPFSYFSRADRLASIGSYSVLLLGLDDGGDLGQPVTRASKVLYLQVFSEVNAAIQEYETDKHSPRCGMPSRYNLNFMVGTGNKAESVHHSRVIHIAGDVLESDVEGQSCIEPVLNRLEDLDRVVGGSAEMFWRGAFPGYNFAASEGALAGTADLESLQAEIEEYMHGLKRYLRTSGVKVEGLPQQVADPRPIVEAILQLIAGASGIPIRKLIGSERGELASSEDSADWNALIDERRVERCEPRIIRPFVSKIVDLGVVPAPANDYEVRWPALAVQGKKEQAEVGKLKAETLTTYSASPGAEGIVPPELFCRKFLDMTGDEIAEIEAALKVQDAELEKEEADAEKAAAALALKQPNAENVPPTSASPRLVAVPPQRPAVPPRGIRPK